MSEEKKTTTHKRRSVSKARLIKELKLVVQEYNLGNESKISELFDAIRNAIVDDAIESIDG